VTGFELRPAMPADETFLRSMVHAALFVPPGASPFPVTVLDEPAIRHYWAGFGRRPGDVGRIAEQASTAIGAAWVRRLTGDDPGYGHIDDDTPELTVAIATTRRGRGIGSALLDELLALVPRCSLSVDDRNPAVRLYDRHGFTVEATDGKSLTMLRR